MHLWLTRFSLRRPWLVVVLTLVATLAFAWQFPQVHFDNDPENMLAEDEHVRVFHNQVKEKYDLYDFVIVGIVNEAHPQGVFNVDTLSRIHRLTYQLLYLEQGPQGLPQVHTPGKEGSRTLDLRPEDAWSRILNTAFNHHPNDLFDAQGRSAIIGPELISPSVVDNIKQAQLGSLQLSYLMEQPPRTQAEALTIRRDAMNNPLYKGTLVSADGEAMCLYIPIQKKSYSHNVANLVRTLTADWPASEQLHITGLPVAEDTFGIEMLVQMATSAPMAGLAIFVLMLLFFRNLSLIIAPMLVAIVSVICTMGLLIGLGFDVHIMSSMIAIFLMPIAVADSIHILSEFFDTYPRFGDKRRTVEHVIGHLFRPMLYTTLTTMAGFASLIWTPIPPVQVFGAHVALGVGLAWLLSMTLIPAYILLGVSSRRLAQLHVQHSSSPEPRRGWLHRLLEWLGAFTYRRWGSILALTLILLGIAGYGISRIQVNDNPVKWFVKDHPIRQADRVLNDHFAGTYTAYLTLRPTQPEACNCQEKAQALRQGAVARFGDKLPQATDAFLQELQRLQQRHSNVATCDVKRCLFQLAQGAAAIDEKATADWNRLADAINYLDPQGLDYARLQQKIAGLEQVPAAVKERFWHQAGTQLQGKQGLELLEAALAVAEGMARLSFQDYVFRMEAELTAPMFKRPEMLQWAQGLEQHLEEHVMVGKISSAIDALKKANYELNYVTPPAEADAEERQKYKRRNESHYSIPDSAAATGQVFVQLEGLKKKDYLFHLVTKDYQEANMWVQLQSGDNKDMEAVVAAARSYIDAHPPPRKVQAEWAGLTYLNVVWQDKMVRGMLGALLGSFVVVFIMMTLLFRSPVYGVLAMLPLSVTIAFIYGLIGLVGKDYDMPVAVLSSLTLGLSVDFAIHFLQRARELQRQTGSWWQASQQMFKGPAMAISRNAITISVGFLPLPLAPLVPYKTVGFFLATIMAVSWLATLFLLPALLTPLRRWLFREPNSTDLTATD